MTVTEAKIFGKKKAIDIFNNIYTHIVNNDVYSLQEAIIVASDLKQSEYELFIDVHELQDYDKNIKAALISKINYLASKGKMTAQVAIFRLKQLGEIEVQNVKTENVNTNKDFKIVVSEDDQNDLADFLKKFDE